MKWLDGKLKAKFEVKTDFLGPGAGHSQELRVLNRVLTWQDGNITYEPDQRHAELIIAAMNVSSSVNTPGSREDTINASAPKVTDVHKTPIPPKDPDNEHGYTQGNGKDESMLHQLNALATVYKLGVNDGKTPMEQQDITKYRGLAARANYLALDRPDLQYAVKEIARRMSSPCGEDWLLLKRLARYLVGAPRGVFNFPWQAELDKLDVYADSDWAACRATGRSTSGGVLMVGMHTIKTWSTTQAVVAMSSGEAELYSLTKGAAQCLGAISLGRDLGVHFSGLVHTDANAALGIIQREGLGKLRHIRVQYLWIQDRIRGGDLEAHKVPGTSNPADLMTKHVSAAEIFKHCEYLGFDVSNTRAATAPTLGSLQYEKITDAKGDLAKVIIEEDNNGVDEWKHRGRESVRVHDKPRRTLFTPRRVAGAPPRVALTSARITRGIDVDTARDPC